MCDLPFSQLPVTFKWLWLGLNFAFFLINYADNCILILNNLFSLPLWRDAGSDSQEREMLWYEELGRGWGKARVIA